MLKGKNITWWKKGYQGRVQGAACRKIFTSGKTHGRLNHAKLTRNATISTKKKTTTTMRDAVPPPPPQPFHNKIPTTTIDTGQQPVHTNQLNSTQPNPLSPAHRSRPPSRHHRRHHHHHQHPPPRPSGTTAPTTSKRGPQRRKASSSNDGGGGGWASRRCCRHHPPPPPLPPWGSARESRSRRGLAGPVPR